MINSPKTGVALAAPAPRRKGQSDRSVAVLREVKRIRAELNDLADYLLILEARARDKGKPGITLQEMKKRIAAR